MSGRKVVAVHCSSSCSSDADVSQITTSHGYACTRTQSVVGCHHQSRVKNLSPEISRVNSRRLALKMSTLVRPPERGIGAPNVAGP